MINYMQKNRNRLWSKSKKAADPAGHMVSCPNTHTWYRSRKTKTRDRPPASHVPNRQLKEQHPQCRKKVVMMSAADSLG